MSELTQREISVLALVRDGRNIAEIAGELLLSRVLVRKALWSARKKGAVVPARMKKSPKEGCVPITALVADRARLRAEGKGHFATSVIARKYQMNPTTVRTRLWRYDNEGATR